MKTSFLKGIFNSKDNNSKSHFNIHNVDLDDSDDIIVCNESFFQRNNSPKENNISKNQENKTDDIFNKKFGIYPFNESVPNLIEMKSPISSKEFNFSKLKSNYDNDRYLKSKSFMEFTSPNPLNVLKTPTKESKLNHFDMLHKNSLNKGMSSPTILSKSFINKIGDTNKMANDDKINRSPVHWKLQNSPKKPFYDVIKKPFDNKFNECLKNVYEEVSINDNNQFNENHKISNNEKTEITRFESHDDQNFFNSSSESLETKNTISDNASTEFDNLNINEVNGAENSKLKVLHVKLKMEAEKIQKWKENMEKELFSKVQKLKESDKIIESLRASNLDFQMQQENISLNYQVEIDCRSEVSKKIENSRHLCQILKQKIENIEKINKSHVNEVNNIKIIQNKALTIADNTLEDLQCFSEVQLKCFENLNTKISSKDNEISNLNGCFSELQNKSQIEATKFITEMAFIQEQLFIEQKKLENVTEENNTNFALKVQSEELFIVEQGKNQALVLENEKHLEEIINLKISKNHCEEDNHRLLEEIEIKKNEVFNLEVNLKNLEEMHLKYKEHNAIEIITLNDILKKNDNIIENLKATILKNEEENKNLNLAIEKMQGDFSSTIQIKDKSIENLTNTLIEKEDNNLNLENINNLNVNAMKDLENEIILLKLEKETLSKNNSILKSSNSDLREELDNQSIEQKKLTEDAVESRIQLGNLNDRLINALTEKENNEELIKAIQYEKQTLTEELSIALCRNTEFENKNKELEMILKNVNEQELLVLREKDDIIEDLKDKITTIQINICEMESVIENNVIEKELMNNDFSILSKKNVILTKTIEELQTSLISKEKDLSVKISEIDKMERQEKVDLDKIKNYQKNITELENLLSENRCKISSLELFADDLSKEKHNILKSREDLRKELMFTLEQCKNEHEIIEKKKNKEIENLKTMVNSLTLDSQNINNKSKSKIVEITNKLINQKDEIEKLESNLRSAISEKDLTKQILDKTTSTMNDLSEKLIVMENTGEELENFKKLFKINSTNHENKIANLIKEIEEKNSIISKLNDVEVEYIDLKNKLLTNSPPMSTQIPEYIQRSNVATPKTQNLSAKLSVLNDISSFNHQVVTPQKTPKGILRQPGSASKRRKVLFDESELVKTRIEMSDIDSIQSDGVDIDLENISIINKESESIYNNTLNNFNTLTTPKKPNFANKLSLSDSKSNGRLTNIRKTPSKASTKLSEKRKKDKENWFDSDNFFGVGVEA